MISIIIPYLPDTEPLLDWTVENVKRIAPDAELILMPDKKKEGLGIMRHRGILKAKHDTVILLDAHMDFSKACFKRMASCVKKNPKSLVCVDCRGLDDLKPNNVHRYGADLFEIQPGGTTSNPKVFVSKWRYSTDSNKTHQVPEILGGCYALSKDWYINGLGGVWQYHRGWGKSEQMITLMNYYMGGDCVCIPSVWAAHKFCKKGEARPQNSGFFKRNCFLLLHAYMPEDRREALLDTFIPGKRGDAYAISSQLADGSIAGMREWIEEHRVCDYDEVASHFSKAREKANYSATEQPRGCIKCGSYASKILKLRAGRRNRVCLHCGHKFATFSS